MWFLLACAPPDPEPLTGGPAGCSASEEWVGLEGDLRISGERRWDEAGRLVASDTLDLRPDPPVVYSERYRWDGEDLVHVAARAGPRGQELPWAVEDFTWAPGHVLLRADLSQELGGEVWEDGFRVYRWDPEGHLAGWVLDLGGDGAADETWEERWSPGGFGWTVEVERSWGAEAPRWFQYREHDAEGRELFRTENWDVDPESEVVLAQTWDEEGRLLTWDLGGVAMKDQSCAYAWEGDDLVEEVCEEVGWALEVSWTYEAPGRKAVGEVRAGPPGETRPVELRTWTWDCPT